MGLTLTDTVIKALEDQSRKISKTGRPLDRKRIDAISAKVTTLPVLDARTPDEILGYDKYGVPR
jgi:antitoxin VapB